MSEDDIFEKTRDAYLCLIHPTSRDDIYRREIATVIALAPSVPDQLVTAMILNRSWRERILGLCVGMAKKPVTFVDALLQSLRDPRGIVIVPTCAALAVLARRGDFAMAKSFSDVFDRAGFDGEVGWAMDKAMHFAGLRPKDVSGRGPNYGQIFEDHVQLYDWLLSPRS